MTSPSIVSLEGIGPFSLGIFSFSWGKITPLLPSPCILPFSTSHKKSRVHVNTALHLYLIKDLTYSLNIPQGASIYSPHFYEG